MNGKDILEKLHQNQIEIFPVKTGLDADCDIILDGNNLDEFVRFCNSINNRIAFCEITYIELEDYVVDKDSLIEAIKDTISDKLERTYFERENELNLDDFYDEINIISQRIDAHNESVRQKITALKEPEIFFADVYVIYNGVQVGVSMSSDYMDNYPIAPQLAEILKDEIISLITPKLSSCEIDRITYLNQEAEQRQHEWEEQERLEKEHRQEIMDKIETFIENDTSLLECTTKQSRRAYAKRLSKIYSEKYNMRIAIIDLETMVNDIYEALTIEF